MTPALASSNIQGVQRLWHCDAHALGHDGAGGCLGHRPCLDTGQRLLHAVDRETCSAVHYQPKQPKTLLVLNRGGTGETEADLWYQAQQAADTLPNTHTAHRHPNWSQAPKLQNQTK